MILNKTLDERIIDILSLQFPLHVKELQKEIFKKYFKKYTPQAIHTSLKFLLSKDIIEKSNSEYQLSTDFILLLDKKIKTIRKNYIEPKTSPFIIKKNSTKIFTTESLLELDELWNSMIQAHINHYNNQEHIYVQAIPHAWFALTNIGEEIQTSTHITQHLKGFYTLINHNTMLDQWIERFYNTKNSYYKIRPNPSPKQFNIQQSVLGDYIITCHYPKEIIEKMNYIFKKTEALTQLYFQDLIALTQKKYIFEIKLEHSPTKAKTLRNRLLKFFD